MVLSREKKLFVIQEVLEMYKNPPKEYLYCGIWSNPGLCHVFVSVLDLKFSDLNGLRMEDTIQKYIPEFIRPEGIGNLTPYWWEYADTESRIKYLKELLEKI